MQSAQTKPFNKAFTLVELLIVISLIIIITGSVVPSFNKYISNQSVKQAQENVKDDLRTVQNKALNGEKSQTELSMSTGDEKVNYWGVEFIPNSNTYTYFISVDTNSCGGGDGREDQRTSSILPGETVIRNTATGCVFFSFANGDIVSTLPGDLVYVGPNDGGSDGCKSVSVTANGLIKTELGDACP